jgi:hypothetical protein
MKRFVFLFAALVFSIPGTGCDSGGSSSPTESATSSSGGVAHPQAKGEVKEFEEKNAKRLADLKAAAEKKAANRGTKGR